MFKKISTIHLIILIKSHFISKGIKCNQKEKVNSSKGGEIKWVIEKNLILYLRHLLKDGE